MIAIDDVAERAAILEYDCGLSKLEAETQALHEARDLALDPPGILGEIIRADCWRVALGLPAARYPFGYNVVRPDDDGGETYRLASGGEAGHLACIVPAVDGDGGIADLVACTLPSPQRMRSRLGAAAVVGLDDVEIARETAAPLLVFDNTLRWTLQGGMRGACIVDWQRGVPEIEGVTAILCAEQMAPRLYDATRRCWPRPTIAYASEKMRHAA